MKKLTYVFLLVAGGLLAQSTTVPDIQKALTDAQTDAATMASQQAQIADQQAQIASLQAQVAVVQAINAACPGTCLAALANILAGATAGQYSAITLCCGPTTVPPTPSGSSVLYIFQPAAASVAVTNKDTAPATPATTVKQQ
jgi:hypothetical protein